MVQAFEAPVIWPGGATWVYHAQITNGAGGSGTCSVSIVPGGGNELEIMYGLVTNGDTTTRTGRVLLRDDGGRIISEILRFAIPGGQTVNFPVTDEISGNGASSGFVRLIVTGTMDVFMSVDAVAASQDATFAIACRIRGGLPTVTEVGQSTPTITINTERIF